MRRARIHSKSGSQSSGSHALEAITCLPGRQVTPYLLSDSRPATACRHYVVTAAQARTALVLRRGPTRWWHLLQWDLAQLTLTPGAWFHGTLYPRRCDISPDGRLFGYFAMKGSFT